MGTIISSSIITKAQRVLQDATGVRWDSSEMLGWLNSGQREILLFKPNAYVKYAPMQLVAGTRQLLPDDAVQLIDIPRNMGTTGTTPGRAIRQADREALDAAVPMWHAATANAVVRHYIYNVLEPRAFYVYPPQPTTGRGYVEAIYGATPADAILSGAITLDDIYETPLLDYMLYRAFSKDSEYANAQRATMYYQSFLQAIGGKARVEGVANPAVSAPANTKTPGQV